MTTLAQKRAGGTSQQHGPADQHRDAIETTVRSLRHSVRLAQIALDGSEPGGALDYLFGALDQLRDDLEPLEHLRPLGDA